MKIKRCIICGHYVNRQTGKCEREHTERVKLRKNPRQGAKHWRCKVVTRGK